MDKQFSGNEIRKQFIEFFVNKGHTAVRSASLVPAGDATLLFTNAGMVQFKDVFLGTDTRPYKRAVDSQKCMRVSGKHNDLDDVGRDDSHHTFFEMLGNWSFGDYYKKEAISWAWELLTEVWGIDKSKLWTTVFKDEKGQIDADEEAYNIWLSQPGIDPSHVLYFGRKENFWEMADTGPCGPCSEIHIDLGPEHCNMKNVPGHVCHVNGECHRFMELWNLVFMQYNRLSPDKLVPLAHPCIDTGMGFERIVSVLQKKDSNYKTDLFQPMMDTIQKLTGATTEEMYKNFTPYRVVADHARAASFLIADGVVPGNIGRNYVCRMIIRRAVRFGQQIGLKEPFMDKVAEAVINNYGEAYPELTKTRQTILDSIRWEEDRFNKTLDIGTSHLNDIVGEMQKSGEKVIDGETCFDLYATHGMPLEITYDIVREFGLDVDRTGFAKASEEHRKASGKGKAFGPMGGEDAEQYEMYRTLLTNNGLLEDGKVKQDPYTLGEIQSKVILIVKNGETVESLKTGDKAEIVTPKTNFYLEMGGQIGDIGSISTPDGKFVFNVTGCRKPAAGLIVHEGTVINGSINLYEDVIVNIDTDNRMNIARNHTATHLLHAALHQVIGQQATQAGSLVTSDRLRFDFNSNSALTSEQLEKIEEIVNNDILKSYPLYTREEKLDQAISEGVTALFGEKYGQIVRVVRIGTDDQHLISAELCGGTHVSNTAQIGLFIITSEGSVATGIRRIEAITGKAANQFVRKNYLMLRNLSNHLNVPVEEIQDKTLALQELATKNQKELSDLREKMAMKSFDAFEKKTIKIGDANMLSVDIPGASAETLRNLADKFKAEHPNAIAVFGTVKDGQAILIASVADELVKRGINAGEIVKKISSITGGNGGGRPTMAQAGGKNPEKLSEALDKAVSLVREKLNANEK